jgi:hypothetical protein
LFAIRLQIIVSSHWLSELVGIGKLFDVESGAVIAKFWWSYLSALFVDQQDITMESSLWWSSLKISILKGFYVAEKNKETNLHRYTPKQHRQSSNHCP